VFVTQEAVPAAPIPEEQAPTSFSVTGVPATNLDAHSAVPSDRAVELQTNGNDPRSALDDPESEALFTTDATDHLNSPASMATEILSAAPDIPTIGIPEEPESELISKDVTLIARGRKRRFRLH
jgi:hypothetical protein